MSKCRSLRRKIRQDREKRLETAQRKMKLIQTALNGAPLAQRIAWALHTVCRGRTAVAWALVAYMTAASIAFSCAVVVAVGKALG